MMIKTDQVISVQRVLELHKLGIEKYGGDYSEPTPDCVERSIQGSFTSALYHSDTNTNPDTLAIACFLLRNLIENHCFTDGNKRVGWSVFIDYLRRHQVGICADQDEAANFVLKIIDDHLSVREIATWAAERLGPPA